MTVRERYSLGFEKTFGAWNLLTQLRSEDKTGTQTMAGAIYLDASNGHAAVLPRPVDYTTNEFDLALGYARDGLAFEVSYLYSDFDNSHELLTWENPYAAGFGLPVDYPAGSGGLALEPDNEMHRLRAMGTYMFSPRLRVRFDGSYAETTQNQSFLAFTVNEGLTPGAALPRDNLDGEVTTSTFNTSVNFRPAALPKLALKASYHYEERENDSPRDGYLYVRGDAWAPDDARFTVYNTTHDRSVNRIELEGSYRLPGSSKLTLGYAYEEIERFNSAVEDSEEDIFRARLRMRPWRKMEARLEFRYRDRGASTYQWDQSFFALLDTALMTRRRSTHPSMPSRAPLTCCSTTPVWPASMPPTSSSGSTISGCGA